LIIAASRADRCRDQAGDDRQRQRDQKAEAREFEPHQGQFPHEDALEALRRPRGEIGDEGAPARAGLMQRVHHGEGRHGAARRHHAGARRQKDALQAGPIAEPSRHLLAREQDLDGGGDEQRRAEARGNQRHQLKIRPEGGKEGLRPAQQVARYAARPGEGRNNPEGPVEDVSQSGAGCHLGRASPHLWSTVSESDAGSRPLVSQPMMICPA
jgi:hypothetical protein